MWPVQEKGDHPDHDGAAHRAGGADTYLKVYEIVIEPAELTPARKALLPTRVRIPSRTKVHAEIAELAAM
jgi:hypothetical protein